MSGMHFDRDAQRRVIPLEQMPGYYAALHSRVKDRSVCECGDAWPCQGAQHQIEAMRPFVPDFWYDAARFAAMAAHLDRQEAVEAVRRAERKAAKLAATEALEEVDHEAAAA